MNPWWFSSCYVIVVTEWKYKTCYARIVCEVLYDMRGEGVLRDTMDMPGQVYPSNVYTVRHNVTPGQYILPGII